MMIRKPVAILVVVLVVLALGYALIPSDHDEAEGLSSAVVSDSQSAFDPITRGDGDIEATLSSKNTTIGFSCAKTVAGKTLLVRGGWSDRFGSMIQGTARFDPKTQKPRSFFVKVRIDSLWSEHEQLTEALLTQGFFRPQDHPWATFEGVYIESGDTEPAGKIAGEFELNGITKHIEFPAYIELADDTLNITSAFSLDRRAYDVTFKSTGGFGLLTDQDIADNVAIKLDVKASWDNGIDSKAVGEPSQKGNQPGPNPVVAVQDLPATYTQTIPATQVQFEMVLVPTATGSGVVPFYVGKHEVTWDEFMPWVQGADLAEEALVGEERALKLRPSSPYGSVDRNFGMYRRPALGMSRMSAELYCRWLSEQTGKHYRLLTEAEWAYAYAQGNPVAAPVSPAEADAIATYQDNSWDDGLGDWATTKIASREPNTLGIYDMAGNVAEWVAGTGDEHVVRGGHFESPLAELGVGRATEDIGAWNRDYPNEPKSQWWYVNARWVGFRVACDVSPTSEGNP